MPTLPGAHASAAAVAAAEAAYYNNGMQAVHPSALGHFVRQPVSRATVGSSGFKRIHQADVMRL